MMNIDKLKSFINSEAKRKNIPHQIIYDAYFFEHFLYRVSKSEYNKLFILKGGFLLGNYVGLESRSTYDIDLSYSKKSIKKDELSDIINEILKMDISDGIKYYVTKINDIMTDKEYPGISFVIEGCLGNLRRRFHVDVATQDVITPAPLQRKYQSLFGDSDFIILSYNKETIIAEKFQSIIFKGINNSRAKDLFDLFVLMKEEFDTDVLHDAIINTFESRGTSISKRYIESVIDDVSKSNSQKMRFEQYSKSHYFAKDVSFDDSMIALKKVFCQIQYIKRDIDIFPKLYMARHGEDDQTMLGGWSKNRLTQKGINQAKKLADVVKNIDIDIIISSSLVRARETSDIVSRILGVPVVYDSMINEINNGNLADISIIDFKVLYPGLYFSSLQMSEKYPNGESPIEFYDRIVSFFDKSLKEYKNKNVLLITHGGVIGIIKSLVYNYKWTNKQRYNIDYSVLMKTFKD